ncbi:MAG: [FeFe] hydrogenase H-cluster maturation GTPase HydF [Lachnospiraceae bacterium]
MAVTLNETPSADRIHIGFYGRTNSGKSSLMNAFVGQDISIVSDQAGTTTDPVNKAMEIHGIGACVLMDTAGFDDVSELGGSRVEKTKKTAEKTDIALILCAGGDLSREQEWFQYFKKKGTPVIPVITKADLHADVDSLCRDVREILGEKPVVVSAVERMGLSELKERIARALPEDYGMGSITGNLVHEGDTVLLVMPQDIQAPKGRLILPQVQTLRDLLDKKCLVMSVTTDKIQQALEAMKEPPALIITDSQVFKTVYDLKPAQSRLTSFSTLFAAYKGDIGYYKEGAEQIGHLTQDSRVLIAECCTHAPLTEDIGREKLPRMLRKQVGEELCVDIVSGTDFPEDLSGYDLIIQCGACMFNRKYVMARIQRAKDQHVPMTNYGVAIAWMSGILDKISMEG